MKLLLPVLLLASSVWGAAPVDAAGQIADRELPHRVPHRSSVGPGR